MDLSQILFVLAPSVAGLVALFIGFHLLRPERGESRTTPGRTVAGILCVLFMVGCLLSSFALWLCVGISNSMH